MTLGLTFATRRQGAVMKTLVIDLLWDARRLHEAAVRRSGALTPDRYTRMLGIIVVVLVISMLQARLVWEQLPLGQSSLPCLAQPGWAPSRPDITPSTYTQAALILMLYITEKRLRGVFL